MSLEIQRAVEHRPESQIAEAIEALGALLGDRLSTAMVLREQHGKGEDRHRVVPPDAVAFAASTGDVGAIVAICARYKTPVIPFGAGTSVEGHLAALHGGISIDLSRMDAIVNVNTEDMDCRVQAGVTREQLNTHLRDTGLSFPIDPGANATIGGMAATRASGTNAVRYGTMRDNVLGLEVVLSDGRIIQTQARARKSSAGYDLTRLFVGSEGTLGVITEVALRLQGIPEAVSAAVCTFPSLKAAVDTSIATIQSGIPIARVELINGAMMEAINAYSKTDYAIAPTLFMEFHGTAAGVKEQAEQVAAISHEFGGGDFNWTTNAEERSRLWKARHDAAYATKAMRPGSANWATDVCVPISRLSECILETERDAMESGLLAPIGGHVGDGNFHMALVADPDDADAIARCGGVSERLVYRALDMDGTCTGEHGIGMGKIKYLEAEHGEAIGVMQQIKMALDPGNIMNPGKVLPD